MKLQAWLDTLMKKVQELESRSYPCEDCGMETARQMGFDSKKMKALMHKVLGLEAGSGDTTSALLEYLRGLKKEIQLCEKKKMLLTVLKLLPDTDLEIQGDFRSHWRKTDLGRKPKDFIAKFL